MIPQTHLKKKSLKRFLEWIRFPFSLYLTLESIHVSIRCLPHSLWLSFCIFAVYYIFSFLFSAIPSLPSGFYLYAAVNRIYFCSWWVLLDLKQWKLLLNSHSLVLYVYSFWGCLISCYHPVLHLIRYSFPRVFGAFISFSGCLNPPNQFSVMKRNRVCWYTEYLGIIQWKCTSQTFSPPIPIPWLVICCDTLRYITIPNLLNMVCVCAAANPGNWIVALLNTMCVYSVYLCRATLVASKWEVSKCLKVLTSKHI